MIVASCGEGFAVYTDKRALYKVGPNPITAEAARYVIGVISRLRINIDPNDAARGRFNDKLVTDARIKAWLENRI